MDFWSAGIWLLAELLPESPGADGNFCSLPFSPVFQKGQRLKLELLESSTSIQSCFF